MDTEKSQVEAKDDPIAVIGMACRFPKAPDLASFWRLLCEGVDAVTQVPKDRWDVDSLFDEDPAAPGKLCSRWGGFLDQVDRFDPHFFGISPREAIQMDPQQRLVLELAWEALEDAGIPPRSLEDSQTGVFIGAMWSDYTDVPADRLGAMTQHSVTGLDLSIIPGRVSYALGLRGPSITLNTASSSSLVAIHYARRSLMLGESNIALAGGVNLLLSARSTVAMSKFGSMAPDGRSKAFDARANGYVRGEGGGVVVLKPLSRAIADRDPIYCVILGSAVNNDGLSNGLAAPSPKAQEQLLRAAYRDAGVDPRDVYFIETHGAGTMVGDPIEASAIGAVLGAGRPDDRQLRLGAVKTNIGHLEAAAGVAGFIKTALALKHRRVPPNLHFREANPHIPFEALRLTVPTSLEPWPEHDGPVLGGVSAFGFSGTNCHVVLSGKREDHEPKAAHEPTAVTLLPLSAHAPEALGDLARSMADVLHQWRSCPLSDILYTASARRSHLARRLAVVGRGRDELAEALSAYARGESPEGLILGETPSTTADVVFVFPGQGSQWVGMGRILLEEEPVFREAILACDEAIRGEAGFSVIEELRADEERSRLSEIDVVQPVLFTVEVALAALWRSWGVEPSVVVGHSMGEIAAAYVAGALTLGDAAAVICRRSLLLRRVSGKGTMALVELPMAEAERALAAYADRLSVAVSNGPRSTVLAGDPAALEEVLAKLEREQVFCRRVKVDVASHSPQMDPLRAELLAALADLSPKKASLSMRSTVTGERLSGEELAAGYWADNLRKPVLFSRVTRELIAEGHALFLEMSPHPILLPSVEENLQEGKAIGAAIASLRRHGDERRSLLKSLGKLYVHGYPVDWKRLYPEGGRVAHLPTYPWQRERFWIESDERVTIASRTTARVEGVEVVKGEPFRDPQRAAELGAKIARADREEGRVLLDQFLSREVGLVLGLDPSRIDRRAPFIRIGLDSLMMMQLGNRIRAGIGVDLSTVILRRHDHIDALASHLFERLSIEHVLRDVHAQVAEGAMGEDMETMTI